MESSLKFKFPAHIVSIVVRTTGCKLGKDQVVAIGAAFVKIPNSVTVPIIVKHELFRCQVDAPQKLDPNYMSAEELAELQIKATPGNVAVKGLLDFVEGCMRQDAGSYIAAQNPVAFLLRPLSPCLCLLQCSTRLAGPGTLCRCLLHSSWTDMCVCADGGARHAGIGSRKAR